MEEAAKSCADIVQQGALEAVPSHVAQYASAETWDRVVRHWHGRNCTEIADLARAILDGKQKIHTLIGKFVGFVVGLFNGSLFARALAEEMAKRAPLPIIDEKATMAARGLQLCGMFICMAQGRQLSACACFADVVKAEGKDRVEKLIKAGTSDWINLHLVRASV